MREIKFRARDVKDKIMKFFDFYKIHCGAYFPNHWRDSTGLACELDDRERYPNELMQYIGLKDKNGKEIFEGDAVHGFETAGGDTFTYEVKYDPSDDYMWGFPTGLCNQCEIIGNIYENPELLKEVV